MDLRPDDGARRGPPRPLVSAMLKNVIRSAAPTSDSARAGSKAARSAATGWLRPGTTIRPASSGAPKVRCSTGSRRRSAPGTPGSTSGAHYGYTAFALARLVGKRRPRVRLRAGGHDRRMRRSGPCAQSIEPADGAAAGSGSGADARNAPSALDAGNGRRHADVRLRARIRRSRRSSGSIGSGRACTAATARFDGIKIDVQGMEIDVLEGMRDALRRLAAKGRRRAACRREPRAGARLLHDAGYSGEAVAIDPADGEDPARLLDDRSYAFNPA